MAPNPSQESAAVAVGRAAPKTGSGKEVEPEEPEEQENGLASNREKE